MGHRRLAAAICATVCAATAPFVAAHPAAAAANTDCTPYQHLESGSVVQGANASPWNYLLVFQEGTIDVCLDGPDDAEFQLELRHFDGGDYPTLVASADTPGADETLSYHVEPGAYRIEIPAVRGGGAFTVGVNMPAWP